MLFTPSDTEYKTPDFVSKDVQVTFGTSYDIPVLCDVDGDGYADMGLCSVDDEEVSFNSIVRRKLQITDIAAIMVEVLSIRLYLCLRV